MTGRTSDVRLPRGLWPEVAGASHRLLMLDHDGTLAPLRVDRAAARPPPGTLDLLGRLAASRHTRVAVISGRPVDELAVLLGPLALELVGEHGWEGRSPAGERVVVPLPDAARAALEDAERRARAAGLGARLERKRTALTLHVRGLAPDHAAHCLRAAHEAWAGAVAGALLRLDPVDGGLELRARGRDKGDAVRMLLAQAPPGTCAVFVGDDASDEDAFEAVRGHGFGVRVGVEERASRASGRLADTEAVARFLEAWLVRLDDGAASAP